MGIVSDRRKKQCVARMRRRLMIAAGILLLGALAMAPGLREELSNAARDIQTFGESTQTELTLPEREVYALQLGVFDSGERAASEAQRLQGEGIRCIVWQREKMRIVSSVAFMRDGLDSSTAKGQDAYVIHDTLEKVSLRLTSSAAELEKAQTLLETPDSVLTKLLSADGDTLESMLTDTKEIAAQALDAPMDNELYTQLAQSLMSWCALMEKTMAETDAQSARSYAAVTMCTLCRELRQTLKSQNASAA